MPTFQYEAMNDAGKPQRGTISAANNEEAIAQIRGKGLFPTSVREAKIKKGKSGGADAPAPGAAAPAAPRKKAKGKGMSITIGGLSGKLLTTFTRQFSTLQDAGLPILRSLQVLEAQQKPGLLKNVLASVQEDVSSGATLSDALSRHPKAFDRLYCKMIAAGEVAGVLEMILQRLADFLEKSAKLKRKIIGAMIYPAVVLMVAFTIMAFIMVFIVPKFEKIFADFNTDLPLPTKVLIDFAAWMAGPLNPNLKDPPAIPGALILLLIPVALFLILKIARTTGPGKAVIDSFIVRAPIFGNLVTKAAIAKMTRTLGTLIRAGVPILDAILITRDTTTNFVFQRALTKVHDSVRQGDSFAEPLRQTKVCDSIVTNMIDVGEETGDLDKMLLKIADNYDDEVDTAVAGFVSLLEPLMVVMLGLIVGSIVVALFLPLVKLIQSVQ